MNVYNMLYNLMKAEQWLFSGEQIVCVCVYLSLRCTEFKWKKLCIVKEKNGRDLNTENLSPVELYIKILLSCTNLTCH